MRRETQNILLILLGGALLKISFSGLYLRYVQKGFLPLLIIAGVVMIGLAGIAIYRDIRGAEEHAHDHSTRSTWLMLLPVLAVFLISPPALGVDVVNSAADTNRAVGQTNGFAELPGGDVVPLSMTEFVMRTAWDSSGTIDNRTVKLTGFIARSEGETYVARLAISCCAADARPLKVRLVGQVDQQNEQWVEVTGKVVPGSAKQENSYVPSFTVTSVAPVAEPAEPYES